MEWWALFLGAIGVAAITFALCALVVILGLGAARRAGFLLPPATPVAAPSPPTIGQIDELTRAELAEARGELAAGGAEWAAHRKQLDAYLDAFEDLEESTERRRRRAAASASKAERAAEQIDQAGELNPNSREAIRQRARARGFRV